jgi:glycosyltransferase involved in cell wall biosynthesis
MRIAQVAPLMESVPPCLYGGTERVVSYLTERLVHQGHDVTLFASADSRTSAKLVRCSDMALRLNRAVKDALPYHLMMLDEVCRQADDFDVIHFHLDLLHFPLVTGFADRTLTTLHGRLDLPDLKPFYAAFPNVPLVSISDSQRLPMPSVRWVGTVPHGLPQDLLPFTPNPRGGYLAFLGRISAEKRPDRAIEIAARAGLPLKIAAKIDKVDRVYWDTVVAPLISRHRNVEFGQRSAEGGIPWQRAGAALSDRLARAVRAGDDRSNGLRHAGHSLQGGSVPEVIDEGVTGFIVDDEAEAAADVSRLAMLDRAKVRTTFERRFSVERMANDYLSIYGGLTDVRRDAGRLRRAQGNGRTLHAVA